LSAGASVFVSVFAVSVVFVSPLFLVVFLCFLLWVFVPVAVLASDF